VIEMRAALPLRARRSVVLLVLALAVAAVVTIVPQAASADGNPSIWWTVEPGQAPGTVTVHGDGWSGAGGVRLYQCSGYPEDGESFWDVCEQATARTVNVDPPWQVDDFVVKPIVDSEAQDPFPPATVNAMGNGTFDCETVDSTCGIFAIEGDPLDFENAMVSWSGLGEDAVGDPYFTPRYGTQDNPLTIEVDGPTTGLKDGDTVMVSSSGHRPGTWAMTYQCRETGPAYPGGCDPVAGSLAHVSAEGVYETNVALHRFIWDNDPFGNAGWYDGVDGGSLTVVSAGNLASPLFYPVTFADVGVEQHPSVLTVTNVLVNKYGAINVSGLGDGSQALAAWGLDDVSVAGEGISWTARQPVGRKGVVTAHYEPAIATICSDPASAGPYPWGAHPPVTSPDAWWVYPDSGGKFVAGKISVVVRFDGAVWGDWWGAENYRLTGASQWDGKAIKR
jgi:hypothetical protein